jgi:NAD(P)-dependent dehydrogenase (short-subunit alcohol dehydrogenase family)
MSDFLSNKTAIITGGSGTIDKAIAKAFLTSGCNVFLTGRNQERLDAAVAELTCADANYGNIHSFQGKVLDEKDVSMVFDQAQKAYGGVDLLVNNAGTATTGATSELSVEEFDRVMRVNVTGPFICAREAINRMKARGGKGGRIVNIGSLSTRSPRPDSAPYTTSKFALLGLSNSLSLDCRKDNIAVGIIHPGNVVTNLLSPEVIAEREAGEGFIKAEDVASCVIAISCQYRGY